MGVDKKVIDDFLANCEPKLTELMNGLGKIAEGYLEEMRKSDGKAKISLVAPKDYKKKEEGKMYKPHSYDGMSPDKEARTWLYEFGVHKGGFWGMGGEDYILAIVRLNPYHEHLVLCINPDGKAVSNGEAKAFEEINKTFVSFSNSGSRDRFKTVNVIDYTKKEEKTTETAAPSGN